ncbi:MAG: bifunctional hydroxymethylpyrimidine kinase/phosphomethylpyrimidine kinase [Rhodospirillales bacterium]|nr:bifunctional hydroxymethylpyrimidine kinase/phosphomethylpyrimidine kinase [Rhodospirillales bacterium]
MVTISVPIALTIAGSDSGGGAGIQADLKAFSALGVYGTSVITAITAQNTRAVTAVHGVPVDIIAAQIDAVFDDIAVNAVKIGMLATAETIGTVAAGLKNKSVPVVLDPVMIAKSGDALLQADAVAALRSQLLPIADLLTPNLPEAAVLLDAAPAKNTDELEAQGRALLALGPAAVLMKGGHAEGPECVDLLILKDAAPIAYRAPRINTKNTHGTGCTLSAAIAAGLAKGLTLPEAVKEAHAYLHGAIAAADGLGVGSGHGPVHHFYRSWKQD